MDEVVSQQITETLSKLGELPLGPLAHYGRGRLLLCLLIYSGSGH